jgi:hypothetical protein
MVGMSLVPAPQSTAVLRRTAWEHFTGHFNRHGYGLAIAVAAVGPLFYWVVEGTDDAAEQVTVWLLTAFVPLAVLLLLALTWSFVSAPYKVLSGQVDALGSRVAEIETATATTSSGIDPLRVALLAVRSELSSCDLRIKQTILKLRWWNPEVELLPAVKWEQHFATLSHPDLPEGVWTNIEVSYQLCHRLNQAIRAYMNEYKNTQFPHMFYPAKVFALREGDAKVLLDTSEQIKDTRVAIDVYLDEAQE